MTDVNSPELMAVEDYTCANLENSIADLFATGFNASVFMRPMNFVGRGGVELNKLWERRPSAYLAVSTPDFPNVFLLNGPSAPSGNLSSIPFAEYQMNLVMRLLDLIGHGKARQVSASRAAIADYDQNLIAATKGTVWASGCSSCTSIQTAYPPSGRTAWNSSWRKPPHPGSTISNWPETWPAG